MKILKISITLALFFNIIGCNPVEKKSESQASIAPYRCVSSQSSCFIDTEVGRFALDFSGANDEGMLTTELPFNIRLTFLPIDKNHNVVEVNSYLEGKTMFMGKVPVFFQASSESNEKTAETLLASCAEEVMTWRLWLKVDIAASNEVIQQEFYIDFDSKRL